jgi:hypothetical protein
VAHDPDGAAGVWPNAASERQRTFVITQDDKEKTTLGITPSAGRWLSLLGIDGRTSRNTDSRQKKWCFRE